MRFLLPVVTLAALAVAAPSQAQAQDFLRGLARAAGTSAGQALIDRATSAATGAVTGGTTTAPGAPASASPAAPASASRQGGPSEMYDANGDRIFNYPRSNLALFQGQPLWRSAAYCAALAQLIDIDIEEQKARHARGGHVYRQDWIDERLAGVPRTVQMWRSFGMSRLRIDHPEIGDGGFDPEVTRQVAELRTRTWTPVGTWRDRSAECSSMYSQIGGLRYDMEAGRGEGSRGAPR